MILDSPSLVGGDGASLGEAGMGEDDDGHAMGAQHPAEGAYGAVEIGGVHEHVVGDHHVDGGTAYGLELRA